MKVEHGETVKGNTECELQLGISSWSDDAESIKFAWPTANGRWARGGEVPVGALPQMLEFAIREGYVKLS